MSAPTVQSSSTWRAARDGALPGSRTTTCAGCSATCSRCACSTSACCRSSARDASASTAPRTGQEAADHRLRRTALRDTRLGASRAARDRRVAVARHDDQGADLPAHRATRGDVLIGRQMPCHFSDRQRALRVAWSSVIGTQLPHAMGAAWAARSSSSTTTVMRGLPRRRCVLVRRFPRRRQLRRRVPACRWCSSARTTSGRSRCRSSGRRPRRASRSRRWRNS